MCHLNILLRVNPRRSAKPIYAFMSAVTTQSYVYNPDGDGVYFSDDFMVKSVNKIDYEPLIKQLKTSQFVISHQRFTTSGFGEDYVQPFDDGGFVLAHNGVLSRFALDGQSDTFVVFKKFIKEFSKSKGSREKKIIRSIKKVFKDDHGSWSVALYDKKKQNLYYFKDSSTAIHLYTQKDKIVYLTTSSANDNFTSLLGTFEEVDLLPYKIYRFNINRLVNYGIVGELEQTTYTSMPTHGGRNYNNCSRSDFYGTNSWEDDLVDEVVTPECDESQLSPEIRMHKGNYVYIADRREQCEKCNTMTNNIFHYTGTVICNDCLEECMYGMILQENKLIRGYGMEAPCADEEAEQIEESKKV